MKSSNFVGGVADLEHGIAAMHLLSHNLSSLNSWFFFSDVYVAMETNITCSSGNPVFTSLANRILDGNVTVKVSGKSTPMTLVPGNHSFSLGSLTASADDKLLWVHHGDTGYFPLSNYDDQTAAPVMHVNNLPRTGDWSSIGMIRPCLFVSLSICLSVRLSVCPSVRLSVCPSVHLSVTNSHFCVQARPMEP